MPRRRRRVARISRPLKAAKYSNETYCFAISLTVPPESPAGSHASDWVPIIPPTSNILGTRKVKNFTVSILSGATVSAGTETPATVVWTMLFNPEGNTPLPFSIGGAGHAQSLQEPNQNVIMSGVVDSNQVYRYKSRLARNLNSGDGIVICLYDLHSKTEDATPFTSLFVIVNYAITF